MRHSLIHQHSRKQYKNKAMLVQNNELCISKTSEETKGTRLSNHSFSGCHRGGFLVLLSISAGKKKQNKTKKTQSAVMGQCCGQNCKSYDYIFQIFDLGETLVVLVYQPYVISRRTICSAIVIAKKEAFGTLIASWNHQCYEATLHLPQSFSQSQYTV